MRGTIIALAGATLAVGATAQPIDYEATLAIVGSPQDLLGTSIAPTSDYNNDGVGDLLIGVIGDSSAAAGGGRIDLVSPVDGSTLLTIAGTVPGARLGTVVVNAGDLNGDGVDDIAAGLPDSSAGGIVAGAVAAFSGADGTELFRVNNNIAFSGFGSIVIAIGDTNGDGVPDLAARGGVDFFNAIGDFFIRVISGVDGSTLYTVQSPQPGDFFGNDIKPFPDANADGISDMLVCAPSDEGPNDEIGIVYVLSGADGSVLAAVRGPANDPTTRNRVAFARAATAIDDRDNDGTPDIAVLATETRVDEDRRILFIASTGTGLTLDEIAPYAASPGLNNTTDDRIETLGDADGDGIDDLLIGAPRTNVNGLLSGTVRVLSVDPVTEIFVDRGDQAGLRLGSDLAPLGDINADGVPDFAAAARDVVPDANAGAVTIYTSRPAPNCNAADLAPPLGSLTFADISAFLAAFTASDPAADLAAPLGAFTFADITAFLDAFAAGCP
jgi:hypothetical protein